MFTKSITIKINTFIMFGILYFIFIIMVFAIIFLHVKNQKEKTYIKKEVVVATTEKEENNVSHTGGAEVAPDIVSKSEKDKTNLPNYIFPIFEDDYKFTSPYGRRISPITKTVKNHLGVDISSIWKARICAIDNGVVIDHWPPPDGYYKGHPIYGGLIKIQHKDNVISVYAHLSESFVHMGDQIKKGDVIGRMGNTGKSDGAHLHFELLINNQNINPLLVFEQEEN